VTPQPSATDTAAPTETDTSEPTATDSAASTATSAGPTATVTLAAIPTDTAAPADTESVTDTPDVTSVAAVVTVTSAPPTDIPAITPPQSGNPAASGLSPELLAAGALLLLILGYIALYLRGAATASRYANGFVIDTCPV